ncbi:MAG: hypothetical protein FJ096_02365 [Deltaproteobacteria bacterium]|nr:hypothetical protein [Deltaproteobacteria bacterium]
MANLKSLVITDGTTQRIPDADTLIVGVGIDAATAGVLTIGGTTATSITLGSATIPVSIPGDVTTVGGTTFTTDATFEGAVTFGNGDAGDTVSFDDATTVISNINMGGDATYKITNLANPFDAQDAATKDYVDNAIPSVNVGNTNVAIGDGTGITGSAALSFNAGSLSSNAPLTIETTVGGDDITLQSSNSINLNPGGTGDSVIVNFGYNSTNFAVRGSSFGGQPLLYVDGQTSQNVGIGTNAPTTLFSVAEKLLIDSNGRITKYDNAAVTKGDLLAGSAASGYVAVGVGTDGQVLQADSDEEGGVSWYTIPAATDYSLVAIANGTAGNATTVAGGNAIATTASTSRVAGIAKDGSFVYVLGIIADCNFDSSLSLAAGDAVYLSAANAGKLTNVAPSAAGEVVAELGIIVTVNTAGGGAAAASVLWQPKAIVVL